MYDPLPPIQESSDNNTTVFVALYVVLLAFFIMLNGVAKVEPERVRKVIGSISSTFSLDEQPLFEPGLDKPRPLGEALSLISYYQEIARVMSSPLELSEQVVTQTGNRMEVTIPATLLFKKNSTSLRSDRHVWLAELAALLSTTKPGTRVSAAFIVGGDGALARARAVALVQALMHKKVSPTTLSAGINADATATITVRFTVGFVR